MLQDGRITWRGVLLLAIIGVFVFTLVCTTLVVLIRPASSLVVLTQLGAGGSSLIATLLVLLRQDAMHQENQRRGAKIEAVAEKVAAIHDATSRLACVPPECRPDAASIEAPPSYPPEFTE